MKKPSAVQVLALGAAVVTVALTGAAFWLSYEHLHDVADGNGLDGIRAWAWPGTVDLFIVAGELLILRAALRDRFDWFAYLLAGVGSLGSIALNVAGVGTGAELMEYIVAAVPPVAALLAFAAVMRQVHERLVPADVPEAVPAYSGTARYVPAARVHPLYSPPVGPHLKAPKSWPPTTPVEGASRAPELVGSGGSGLNGYTRDTPLGYVPGPVPTAEVHVPGDGYDELTELARKEFADLLEGGRTPSIRQLRSTYSIGQPRAERIQRELLPVAPAPATGSTPASSPSGRRAGM